ncbi:MAG TPA: hypothetical protein VF258_11465, partial [Luteolibacter sp.]
MIRSFHLSFLVYIAVPATAVEFPATPPGPAISRVEGTARFLENQILSARYVIQDNTLKLDRIIRPDAAAFVGSDDLFIVRYANGSTLDSSGMTLSSPPLFEEVSANPSHPRAADAIAGKALSATFRDPASTLEVTWRATLRDDAGYLRQSFELRSLAGNHSISTITGLTGTLRNASLSGYTDGSVAKGDGFFAGLETPVAKTTVSAASSLPIASWNPALVIPKRMTFPVTFGSAGSKAILFQYTSGNHRLDIT